MFIQLNLISIESKWSDISSIVPLFVQCQMNEKRRANRRHSGRRLADRCHATGVVVASRPSQTRCHPAIRQPNNNRSLPALDSFIKRFSSDFNSSTTIRRKIPPFRFWLFRGKFRRLARDLFDRQTSSLLLTAIRRKIPQFRPWLFRGKFRRLGRDLFDRSLNIFTSPDGYSAENSTV